MVLDGGRCLPNVPGNWFLRHIEGLWLNAGFFLILGTVLLVGLCYAEKQTTGVIVIFYALLYFVIFGSKRTFVKVFIIWFLLAAALEIYLEQRHSGWYPTLNITRAHHR
jgi:hypothetical protein